MILHVVDRPILEVFLHDLPVFNRCVIFAGGVFYKTSHIFLRCFEGNMPVCEDPSSQGEAQAQAQGKEYGVSAVLLLTKEKKHNRLLDCCTCGLIRK